MTLTAVDLLDLLTDLYESASFIGFLTLVLEPKYSKKTTKLAFIAGTIVMFFLIAARSYHKHDTIQIKPYEFAVDYILYIAIPFTYCLIFFKSKKSYMLIMSILALVINIIVTLLILVQIYLVLVIISHKPILLIEQDGFLKLILIVPAHILDVLVYWLIIKKASKRHFLMNRNDVITFIVIPVMMATLIACCINVLTVKDNDVELLIILFIISLITVAIAIIYGVMFSRISRDNQLRTEYLLTRQKMNLYEESVIKSGKQIEKMSKIKHDTKNHLLSIGNLISSKKYDDAKELCTSMSENLQRVYTPINTENILLNAIVNVELDKAESENIDFKVQISDYLRSFSGNSDIISIIGNICDNAIEYLRTQPKEQRCMSLKIAGVRDYSAIVCKNRISESILENNSMLKTSKDDKVNHGKGTNIVREICEKYYGNVSYKEENNEFIVTVLLKDNQEVTV